MKYQTVASLLVCACFSMAFCALNQQQNVKKSFLSDAMGSLDKSSQQLINDQGHYRHHFNQHHHVKKDMEETGSKMEDESDESNQDDDDDDDVDYGDDEENSDKDRDNKVPSEKESDEDEDAENFEFQGNIKNQKTKEHKRKERNTNSKKVEAKKKENGGGLNGEKANKSSNSESYKTNEWTLLQNFKNQVLHGNSNERKISQNLKSLRQLLVEDLRKVIQMTHSVAGGAKIGQTDHAKSISKIQQRKDIKSLALLMETANKLMEETHLDGTKQKVNKHEHAESVSTKKEADEKKASQNTNTQKFIGEKNDRENIESKSEQYKIHKDTFIDNDVGLGSQTNIKIDDEAEKSDIGNEVENDRIIQDEEEDQALFDRQKAQDAFRKAAKKVSETLRMKSNTKHEHIKNVDDAVSNGVSNGKDEVVKAENSNENKTLDDHARLNKESHVYQGGKGKVSVPVLSSELLKARKAFSAAKQLVEAAKARLRLYSAEKTFLEKVGKLLKSQESLEKKRKSVTGEKPKDKSGEPLSVSKQANNGFVRLSEDKEKKKNKTIVEIKKPEKDTSDEFDNAENEAEHMEENVAKEQEKLYANLQRGEEFAENKYLGGYSYPNYYHPASEYPYDNDMPEPDYNYFNGMGSSMKKSGVRTVSSLDNETAGMQVQYKTLLQDKQSKKNKIVKAKSTDSSDDINIKTSYI